MLDRGMIADKIHTQKGKRSCVRPKRPLDISTKLRSTQIILILLPSTQTPEEPVFGYCSRYLWGKSRYILEREVGNLTRLPIKMPGF